jgi:hypothetical protein
MIYLKIKGSREIENDCLGLRHHKYPGSSEMWCWRRVVKTSWTDRVRNGVVSNRVKKDSNILLTTRQTMYFRATIVVVEKQKYYLNSMCLCSLRYPACKAHAQYYTIICRLSMSTVFSHIISWTADVQKTLLNKKCVFWFSLQILTKAFLILRRTEGYIVINVHRSSCKVLVIFFRLW